MDCPKCGGECIQQNNLSRNKDWCPSCMERVAEKECVVCNRKYLGISQDSHYGIVKEDHF